jgi:acetoin utilization deacetylase AcuC-like enzyme
LSGGDFARLARLVGELAPGPARVALFLEGGYDLAALTTSTYAALGTLMGLEVRTEPETSGGPGIDQLPAGRAVRRAAIDLAHQGVGP